MSDTRKLRFRVGVFVLMAFVLLAGLIYLFGLYPNFFRSRSGELYFVEFDDAPGLAVNTPVRRSGLRVGAVEDVELDDDNAIVRAALRIEPRFRLRRGDEPTLSTGVLSGDTTVDLVPRERNGGQPDHQPAEPGSTLRGKAGGNVNQLVAQAQRVVPPAQDTLERMQRSLERLEKMAPLAEETLREYRDLAKETRAAIPELRETNKLVQQLVKDSQQVVKDSQQVVKDAGRLAKEAADLVPEIRKTNDELNKLAQQSQKLVKDVNTDLVPAAEKTLEEARLTLKNWSVVGEESAQLLQRNRGAIDDLIKNSNEAARNVALTFKEDNRANLSTNLANLAKESGRFPSITRETEGLLKDGRQSTANFNDTLRRLNQTLDTINGAVKPGGETQKGMVQNLSEASDKLNRTMTDVRELLRAVAQSDGTVRRFLVDPSLYNRLDEAACMVTRLIPRLDRVLKDMEVFADKLARHPESLGLGGLVRPSAGLKDPPSRMFVPAGQPPFHP